ncbi:MAG: alpha/beta hydrolase [Sandaracinaceae bacterium]|nr:alpha/beta hydrolase [Sandaracinaceae bacterium]
MTSPLERTVVANGLSHHVLVWNDAGAPTLVCCHGFLDLAWSFAPFAEQLARAGVRVVAFDWRGHGETEHVGAGGYYHFPDYVLDLHRLMPSIAPEGPAHLLGHSMGGTACTLYAATHPGALATLTLVEGLGPPSYEGDPVDKLGAWLASMDRHARGAPRPIADLDEAVARLSAQNGDLSEDFARVLAAKATRPEGGALAWRFDPLHRTTSPNVFTARGFSPFLARVDVPVLVVTGSRGFRTADHAERLAALRDAREVELDDVGHMIHHGAPDRLAAHVLAHIGG